METDANGEKKRFPDHRLRSHDYGMSGAYFVTICAFQREHYFAIPALASILRSQWQDLPRRFPTVSLDRFVIMPDHIHFIVWLRPQGDVRPTLSEIVGAYKSLSAGAWLKYLKENTLNANGRIWQRGYYDRIIRNKQELHNARRYIENNPAAAKARENE